IGHWISARVEDDIELIPQLDGVPALSAEREKLWARLEAASFVTEIEKRTLAGLPAEVSQ
ncbi:MAG: phage portal protein, partial [Pseudomonadota bacterium]